MLVLGRKINERLLVGNPGDILTEPIVIELVAIKHSGTTARIGVECQRTISVHREEIAQRIEGGSNETA